MRRGAEMKPRVYIETEQLILRDWADANAESFARMNADPRVMEFFPKPLERAESDALMPANMRGLQREAMASTPRRRRRATRASGSSGSPRFGFPPLLPRRPGRLACPPLVGDGYATEGARAVIDDAFTRLALPSLVSFTAEWNMRSRRVMEKAGMIRDIGGDFLHPGLPAGHKLAPHVLYRIDRDTWQARKRDGPP